MFRVLIRKFGIGQITFLVSLLSVLISVALSALIHLIADGAISPDGIIISIIVPAVISPFFSLFFLRLLYQLDLAEEKLCLLSRTDELTQTYNRRYFFELAQLELDRAARYDQVFSIILFDLDDFKQVNDRFGHAAGDYVLKAISQACQENSRPNDIFARYGGEEFILLLPNTSASDAAAFAQRVMTFISSLDLNFQGKPLRVSASMGVKSFNSSETLDEIIVKADNALYEAKRKGKNCLVSADQVPASAS